MNDLRTAAQQALEALELVTDLTNHDDEIYDAIAAIRAALAQEQAEPDLSYCPQCNGPADNGFDRSIPPNPYLCTKCMAEPCPNCASLEAQNTELDRKLAEMERVHGIMDKPEFRVERGSDTTNEEAAIGMAKLLEREGRTVAADMLRQLHAENQRLCAQHANLLLDTRCAKARRDALLKALKYIDTEFRKHGRQHWPEAVRARAAIKAVEGEDK